ncbi:hypothetical protein O181_101164 [Austropuccinia psidii MF-1]|uniref:Uncharacterized protein n=1 Tax=Austropuccinia psidii MF-1 TaxID=1389203 RepID=A0A9Q3JG17_9BASI|nr:hypothetical protein [Austropuccinia psidii MF-1]
MVRQGKIETESTATIIIPASNVNSDHNRTVIIAQNNQTEPISSELINLDICNNLEKANNLANNQEQAITPQEDPPKGYGHDYGRSQSVTEGQGSVNEAQNDKLFHYESDNTILPLKRAETTTRILSGHIKSLPE